MLDAIRSIFIADDGSGRNILQKYGWHLVFTFIAIYYLRENLLDPFLRKISYQKSYKDATRPGRVLTLRDKMEITREEQQKKAQMESDAAKKKRAEQKRERLEKSAVTPKKKNTNSTSSSTKKYPYRSDSHNPMAPNASGSCSYRPAKRSTGGGG
mmetsp:Transcript_22415/g.34198  ORF Transcript_22415/g.34198 Transcript_22415/m.34198 type:complete len:155 (+) Transcript_22415:133-597(+)|eukprot:CAMPEP_0194085734 /NCGR_PEP_ID=MMETSP0149-20130528/18595_1 /TAXON_ID=122233 /ORGANISM="Chaetoceros debilis, Strain MM31A-1" /LENGTH=154 /DNA_ID=CAMNT_0038768687 /DNA_START=62 /DNA_END=526 /DNA_ORIENTATION=-